MLDRWWTEEPVLRRYFEVVLESGENTVVFHDGSGGGWFMLSLAAHRCLEL